MYRWNVSIFQILVDRCCALVKNTFEALSLDTEENEVTYLLLYSFYRSCSIYRALVRGEGWKGEGRKEMHTFEGRKGVCYPLVIHSMTTVVSWLSRIERKNYGQKLKGRKEIEMKNDASRRVWVLDAFRGGKINIIKCWTSNRSSLPRFVHSRDRTRERRWINWCLRIELIDVRLCYYVAVSETVVDKWA